MVGRLVLVQEIGVRIPVSEPENKEEYAEHLLTLFSSETGIRKTQRTKSAEGRARVGAAGTYERSELVTCAESK